MDKVFSLLITQFRRAYFRLTKPYVFSIGGVALGGYDPVSYFKLGVATKGNPVFTVFYLGSNWHFVSQEHLSAFKADPDQFVPQFGGFCSYGMCRGYAADTHPDAWTIVDNKLFMNHSLLIRSKWNENQNGCIDKANLNWKKVHPKSHESFRGNQSLFFPLV